MTLIPYAFRQACGTDHSTSDVEESNVPEVGKPKLDRRTGRDRRQSYDTDYFARGGIERRRGSWDRRSGKERRFALDRGLTFDPKYIFGPERRRGQERRSGMDRRKTQTDSRMLYDLSRLEHTLNRRKY